MKNCCVRRMRLFVRIKQAVKGIVNRVWVGKRILHGGYRQKCHCQAIDDLSMTRLLTSWQNTADLIILFCSVVFINDWNTFIKPYRLANDVKNTFQKRFFKTDALGSVWKHLLISSGWLCFTASFGTYFLGYKFIYFVYTLTIKL